MYMYVDTTAVAGADQHVWPAFVTSLSMHLSRWLCAVHTGGLLQGGGRPHKGTPRTDWVLLTYCFEALYCC